MVSGAALISLEGRIHYVQGKPEQFFLSDFPIRYHQKVVLLFRGTLTDLRKG